MMKKTLGMVAVSVCLLMTTVGAQAAPVRVFEETASDPIAMEDFKNLTIGKGWADPQKGINTGRLSALACRQAEQGGLITTEQGGKCIESFQKWNALNTNLTSWEAFKTTATATEKGYWIASIEEMQGPAPVAKAEVAKLKSYVSAADSKVVALDAKVEALDESNTKFQAGVTTTLASINNKISVFQQGVEDIGKKFEASMQKQVAATTQSQKSTNDAQNKRIIGIESEMEVVKTAGVTNSKNINGLNKAINTNAEVANNLATNSLVGFVVGFLALVLLSIAVIRNSANNRKLKNGSEVSAEVAKKVAEDVEGLKSGFVAFKANQDTEGGIMDELVDRVEVLAKQQKELSEAVSGYSFDESLVQSDKLKALKVGDSVELVLKALDDDSDRYLELERTDENKIIIHGVLRQKGVQIYLHVDGFDKVIPAIKKAGKAGRIEGVPPPSVMRVNPLRTVA